MSRKWKERKAQVLAAKSATTKPGPSAEVRRRRNRRFMTVGLLAIALPIVELIAYQFRAITISLVNRSEVLIKGVKVTYPGGEIEASDLKPGGSVNRVIRPRFSFQGAPFSTYALTIRYTPENGQVNGYLGRVGTIDYSATEMYTFTQSPPAGEIQLQHASRPGFPLSLVRDLMERLGFG